MPPMWFKNRFTFHISHTHIHSIHLHRGIYYTIYLFIWSTYDILNIIIYSIKHMQWYVYLVSLSITIAGEYREALELFILHTDDDRN